MRGRLIGVVGPSGVGKDTLMTALAAKSPDLGLVRRVITRAPGLGGEAYRAVSEAEFADLRAAGAFWFDWQAHGLSYGIPLEIQDEIAAGADRLVNLSRSVLGRVDAAVPDFLVLKVTARPEVLAARLAARGRETQQGIDARLAKANKSLPGGLNVMDVQNDGALEASVAQAMAALYPVSA